MKSIDTLIPDVYELLERKEKDWFTDELSDNFAHACSIRLKQQLGSRQGPAHLRLSAMGPRCPKALWHSIHTPELAEPLPAWASFKYSYGHVIEALAITLAKAAGHTVEGEQDVIELDGVQGHRDCVIDGCTVDVKSSSSRGFIKFKDKSISQNDSFGYLDQLDGYVVGSISDPIVKVKDRGYLWAIDKQLGHMCLYEHRSREQHIRSRIASNKAIIARPEPPDCECELEDIGRSGNVGLGVKASYSPFKYSCFPNLRTFLYANGPVFLTKVVRKPDVTEVDKNGQIVYN